MFPTQETDDGESGASEEDADRIRILLVDDQQLVREGLWEILSQQEDMEVVVSAATAAEALGVLQEASPDVLLLDAVLPDLTALALTREVLRRYPGMGVIALADCDASQCRLNPAATRPAQECRLAESHAAAGPLAGRTCLELALMAGARGVLRKTGTRDELVRSIRTVSQGEPWIEAGTASRLATMNQPAPDQMSDPLTPEGLTRREVEVIRELCAGQSNKEIGRVLGIREQTVKNTVSRVLAKLRLDDRVQIALYAVETHLLERYGLLSV
jgi:DNA-binding NarL/FixJ family response regulator